MRKACQRGWSLGQDIKTLSSVLLTMTSNTGVTGNGVYVQFPLPEERLFRNQATEDVLLLFVRNPHSEFSVTQIRDITGHGGDTIQTALTVLKAANILESQKEGRKKMISANRDRIRNPDDPVLSIPQEEFRDPVREFLKNLEDVEAAIVGVILFGSVARGEADRASDIDLQVIVDGKLTKARRDIHDVRQKVENMKFEGDRYEIQALVESVESAESYGEKLQEIFREGIKLRETDLLEEVREEIFDG